MNREVANQWVVFSTDPVLLQAYALSLTFYLKSSKIFSNSSKNSSLLRIASLS